MKTIYIVFNDSQKSDICINLFENLKFVFEDYINVKLCFLDETRPGDISDGDLFLVLYKTRVYPMKEYISSLEKVIVLSRTFERKYLDKVYELEAGTDVLVVNDSQESTLQTINNLYELGLNHLNLIPYIPSEDNSEYRHIEVAITPDEEETVPPFIKTIINVSNRCIDVNTFVKIINKLDLSNPQITKNLLSYIHRTTDSTGKNYISDSIKDQILRQTIQLSSDAYIITDAAFQPIFYNDKAIYLFGLSPGKEVDFYKAFEDVFNDLFSEDYTNKLISLHNSNYIVSKTTVYVVDQPIGYSFRISAEGDIKDMENDLSKQLTKSGLFAKYNFSNIVSYSKAMDKSLALAKKIALTDYTILIMGESGTGKELIAQSIHNFSNRCKNPFVAINCAALPENLLESELFGYEKGAFTGASSQGKVGLFEQANHGTIFLDEIGDMPLSLQARLLRVLQERQITRIGSDRVINIDIRILAATNKDLEKAVNDKLFREDLYYRLCNIPLLLPPLRERKEDIPYLFNHFTNNKYKFLNEDEKELLLNYGWPGNVRELYNAANYYVTLGELPRSVVKKEVFSVSLFKDSTLEDKVFEIIVGHTEDSSGIGRVSIQQQLLKSGISISDDKLRKILKKMELQGRITIGKGRKGCMANSF